MATPVISPNYTFLPKRDAILAQLGTLAEHHFIADPNACLVKLRQFGEIAAQRAAAQTGIFVAPEEPQADLLRRLRQQGVINQRIADIFHGLRKAGNQAVHHIIGSQREALHQLKMAHQLAIWFYRSFHQDRTFNPDPFLPPQKPADASEALSTELDELRQQLDQAHAELQKAQLTAEEQRRRRDSAEYRAVQRAEETEVWQQLAEQEQHQREQLTAQLVATQAQAAARPQPETKKVINQAYQAAEQVDLDERATRHHIDQQLRDASWTVDTRELTHKKGCRPAKGQNLAIAEWPTANGPADYALFIGLQLIAIVEAKRDRRKVPAALEQAKRYARGIQIHGDETLAGTWPAGQDRAGQGDYKAPFLFATNGRPFFRQLIDESGIWFIDVRRPQNLARPLTGWYTPDGLKASPIRAVEAALQQGQRECLVA